MKENTVPNMKKEQELVSMDIILRTIKNRANEFHYICNGVTIQDIPVNEQELVEILEDFVDEFAKKPVEISEEKYWTTYVNGSLRLEYYPGGEYTYVYVLDLLAQTIRTQLLSENGTERER